MKIKFVKPLTSITIIVSIAIIAFAAVAISDNIGNSKSDTTPMLKDKVSLKKPNITVTSGSSSPGCEDTKEGCYVPYHYNAKSLFGGTELVFENTDTAAHTFTSGTSQKGPDGIFDSGIIVSGAQFTVKIDGHGEYDYFCMVHPWMKGKITV